jgi:hypothetical protein
MRKTMNELGDVKVLFVAGFGPIVREVVASRRLYGEAFGIHFTEETGGYLHTEKLKGVKRFALWPLSQAAKSCFGKDSWPVEIPAPQAWLELDVESVEGATTALGDVAGAFAGAGVRAPAEEAQRASTR